MQNWDALEEGGECPGEKDWRDVQSVCRQLEIPCQRVRSINNIHLFACIMHSNS
jgi:tRNA-specific 2-thiouridylase